MCWVGRQAALTQLNSQLRVHWCSGSKRRVNTEWWHKPHESMLSTQLHRFTIGSLLVNVKVKVKVKLVQLPCQSHSSRYGHSCLEIPKLNTASSLAAQVLCSARRQRLCADLLEWSAPRHLSALTYTDIKHRIFYIFLHFRRNANTCSHISQCKKWILFARSQN